MLTNLLNSYLFLGRQLFSDFFRLTFINSLHLLC